MGPWQDIELAIREATGAPFSIESRAGIGGGCINSAFRIDGSSRYFVKLNTPDKTDMFAAEAAGLEEIARARAVRTPQPICHGASQDASWIVLEYLELEPANGRAMRGLGKNLAQLHRAKKSERYGWHRDNTLGMTPQANAWAEDWVAFWRERRLGFQLKLAASTGHGGGLISSGERLMENLPAFFAGYNPPPSLLHGDLWSGNAAMTADGEPVIYDPAVYYGDREADLAMTELFGGYPPAFYDAYRADYPLDAGYETRKHLYNLYHVLNHFHLFGGGYRAQAERMIGRLLAEV